MRVLGHLMKHFHLVSRMAQTTRTDLVDATDSGALSEEEWADMVQTCRSCGWTGKCQDWLDTHDKADCPPDDCLNRARFKALKAKAATKKGLTKKDD